ncbi:MAG: Sir2 family NAD-dependent protein deacetylase [Bacteroidota bacterium]
MFSTNSNYAYSGSSFYLLFFLSPFFVATTPVPSKTVHQYQGDTYVVQQDKEQKKIIPKQQPAKTIFNNPAFLFFSKYIASIEAIIIALLSIVIFLTTRSSYKQNRGEEHKQDRGEEENDTSSLSAYEKIKLQAIAQDIKEGKTKNIVILTGAGISTNGGIPDFRSEGGFYNRVKEYYQKKGQSMPPELKSASDFYTNKFLEKNPEDFYAILQRYGKLSGGTPTLTHYFFTLLDQKGLLTQYYTQNVDDLEKKAGLSGEKIYQYHGSMDGAHCMKCKRKASQEAMKPFYQSGEAAMCSKLHGKICDGVMKPNAVFFGDPVHIDPNASTIAKESDLIIILGTSLRVYPFAGIPDDAPSETPRLFVTKALENSVKEKFTRKHDLLVLHDCDFVIKYLIDCLGWENEIATIMQK